MNENSNKKGKNYYGKQILLDYDKFVKEAKADKADKAVNIDYNIDFDELAEEFISEYIKDTAR